MTSRDPARAGGVAIVVVAGAVSACSSDGPGLPIASPSSPSSSSTAAANPSTELFGKLRAAAKSVHTLHFTADSTVIERAGEAPVYLSGSGTTTFSDGRASRQHMTLEANETRGQVIIDDTGVYLRVAGRNAPGGKPWVRYRQSLPVAYLQVFAAFGVLVGPVSPVFSVALQPGATNVRKRLETTEAGVRVTPYAMDLDPAKVSTVASILQKFAGAAGQLDATESIDEKGRPVMLYVSGSNSGARFSLSVSYSKYDSPVTITAPPASQVAG